MIAQDREQWRAAIGPRSERYLERFEMFELAGGRRVATWNWPAFFLSTAWFAYRRMGGYSLLNFFLPILFIVLLFLIETGPRLLVLAAYLGLAFVAIPMYADWLYYRYLKSQFARAAASAGAGAEKKLPRPPSFVTGVEAFLTAAIALFIPCVLLVAPAMYSDYTPRSKVSEGVSLAVSLREPIAVFYAEHKRLPAAHEAGEFRIDGGKYTESVVYDADRRMIVVTIGDKSYLHHKRFAMHAEEKGGAIVWSCRTIDLDRKYLPAMCRD